MRIIALATSRRLLIALLMLPFSAVAQGHAIPADCALAMTRAIADYEATFRAQHPAFSDHFSSAFTEVQCMPNAHGFHIRILPRTKPGARGGGAWYLIAGDRIVGKSFGR